MKIIIKRLLTFKGFRIKYGMTFLKVLIVGILATFLFLPEISFATIPYLGVGTFDRFQSGGGMDIDKSLSGVGLRIIQIAKYVFSGILLIIIVYAGALMIMSMGSSEDDLSKAKRILRYSLIGILFINMPGAIYDAFTGNRGSAAGGLGVLWNNDPSAGSLIINTDTFVPMINNAIVRFLKILIIGVAIMVIMLAGIKILTSRGRDDTIKEARSKILWSIIGLIFVGFIEAWQKFVYTGHIAAGTDIFKSIANLALFLAIPTALFFLTLAGYYFITAAGDVEKTKKGRSIVINTFIAVIILLVSYVFLQDLMSIPVVEVSI